MPGRTCTKKYLAPKSSNQKCPVPKLLDRKEDHSKYFEKYSDCIISGTVTRPNDDHCEYSGKNTWGQTCKKEGEHESLGWDPKHSQRLYTLGQT